MNNWKDLFVLSAFLGGFSLHVLAAPAAHTSSALPAKDALPASSPTAGAPTSVGPQSATAQNAQKTKYLKGLGHILVANGGLISFGFDAEERRVIVEGVSAALNGEENPINPEDIGGLQELLQQKETDLSNKNKEEGKKFISARQAEGGWRRLDSGCIIKIEKSGDSERATDDSVVTITYEGKLTDGKTFDKASTPITVTSNALIVGLREAMQQIGVGGKMRVIIPPESGYGDTPSGPIPGGSTLDFTVEVHEIKHPTLGKKEPNSKEASKEKPNGQETSKGKEESKPSVKTTTAK